MSTNSSTCSPSQKDKSASAASQFSYSPEEDNRKSLNTIWDDDKIEKYTDNKGQRYWKCLWCSRSFQHWNATKALFHVNKETGGDVRKCSSAAIDSAHKQEYRKLMDKHSQQKRSQKTLIESKKRSSDEYLVGAGEAYTASRKKKSRTLMPSPDALSGPSTQDFPIHLSFSTQQETPSSRSSSNIPRYHQQKLGDVVDQASEAQLSMAIADLIHSCGLPFSLASHHKFQRVLSLAKCASTKYVPPGRNRVAGDLLDLNYKIYTQGMMEKLMKEANVYGLSFFGDGATIRKSPLINILASSVHLPVGCLRIVDCTGHLESDGRKDAGYIADLFLPHICEMENKEPKCTDLVIFDGASNVQKAGLLIEAKFPHITIIHGAEHVISLFFNDVFRLHEFDLLKRMNRLIYRYFGSGSMHSPYAIFSKHSRDHNGGKCIGLIRGADTRMAGHVISMLRTLRLKDPLISTISSASFIQGKFKVSFHSFLRTFCHSSH